MVVKGNVRGVVMSVHLPVRIHASRVVVMLVKHIAKHPVKKLVMECVTLAVLVVLMLQNK